jgi:hypothetical protein
MSDQTPTLPICAGCKVTIYGTPIPVQGEDHCSVECCWDAGQAAGYLNAAADAEDYPNLEDNLERAQRRVGELVAERDEARAAHNEVATRLETCLGELREARAEVERLRKDRERMMTAVEALVETGCLREGDGTSSRPCFGDNGRFPRSPCRWCWRCSALAGIAGAPNEPVSGERMSEMLAGVFDPDPEPGE